MIVSLRVTIQRLLALPTVLVVAASCTTAPKAASTTTMHAPGLTGPWSVVSGGTAFFNAESVLFTADGRVRITREGKLRRGSWTIVDAELEVKGIEQSTRYAIEHEGASLLLTPVVEPKRGSSADPVMLTPARVLPTKAG